MVNRNIRSIFIIVSYIAMVVVNYLAQSIPLNGVTSAEVSNSMPNLFAPPGFTFAIWGVIYFLLGALVLYRVGVFQTTPGTLFGMTEDMLLVGTSLMNIAWIFCWHYGHIALSVVVIVILLVMLAVLFNRVSRIRLEGMNRWFVKLPIGTYFGWITVATIANISACLVKYGWDGFGLSKQLWTLIVILLGTCIGVLGTYKKCNYIYGIVFIWTYIGILYKHLSDKYYDGKYITVILATVFGLIVLIAAEILTALRGNCKGYKEF